MASSLRYIYKCFVEIENTLIDNFLKQFSPGLVAPALIAHPGNSVQNEKLSLTDLLQNPFLWAVPKRRRTLQKKRNRRFGVPDYDYKILVPKTNILVCNDCGGYKEAGLLCGNCYKKVMDETKEMQSKIQESLGLKPVEEEVVVLYEGEESEENSEFWKGKRIVEMKKPRPKFFSNNLLQKTTQPNSESDALEIIHPVKE